MFSFLSRLTAGTPSIDVAELDDLLKRGAIRVLDIREDREYKTGHVPGAIHIPVTLVPDRIGKLKRGKPYAVICQSGGRSVRATDFLLENGFEGSVTVRGGTEAWRKSGRPLVW